LPGRVLSRKGKTDEAVIENFGFGTKDFTFLRAKVWRLVAIELDARAKLRQLDLLQPPSVYLDIQPKEDSEGGVTFDVYGSTGAFDHGLGPGPGGRGRAENGNEQEKKRTETASGAHRPKVRNSAGSVKFPTAFGSMSA
jgi:hypothetical protein